MDINNASLLPFILDALSRNENLSVTIDGLCEQIQDVVIERVVSPFGSIKRAVEFSLDLGINLGLLSLSKSRVRLPFNYRSKCNTNPNLLEDKLTKQEIQELSELMLAPFNVKRRAKPKAKPKVRAVKCVAGRPKNAGARSQARRSKKKATTLRKSVGRNPVKRRTTKTQNRR